MSSERDVYSERPIESLNDLRPRHREVLARVARGDSNREIATDLNIGPKTVSDYISAVYRGVGFDSGPGESSTRVKATLWYWRQWTPEQER